MKNFLKTIFFAFLVIAIGSCEEDIDPKVVANGFELRAASLASPLVLAPQNDSDEVASLQWDKSNNGVGQSVSTYKIEVAESGTNFANSVTANGGNNVTTADRSYVLTVRELNTLVNQLPGYQCGVAMDVDIRVKSTLGGTDYNAFVQYSTNVVTVNVTPYSSALPTLAFSATDAITGDTPKMAASSILNTDYEGYMWLTPGSYKLYKASSCGLFDNPTVYGDDGSGSFNTLILDGSGYQVITAGFYLVRANTGTNEYSVRPTTWNVFGTAKNFPLANAAMAYDEVTKLWRATISMSEGYGFKFRSNGAGTNLFVLGRYLASTVGTSEYGGPVLSYVPNTTTTPTLSTNELGVPGTRPNPRTYTSYDITLDLNTPRDYKYSITLHP